MVKRISVCFLLCALVMMAACDSKTYRKILDAENGVAQSIGAGTNIVSNLYDQQIIDRGEKNAIAGALLDANRLLDTFNAGAKAVHAQGDSKAAYLTLVDQLASGVRQLNAGGSLHVKNANARAQVDALFASIRASVEILKNAIVGAQP